MRSRALFIALLLTSLTCPAKAADRELAHVASFMTGTFTSSAQSARDTSFFDIHLHIVPIWTERTAARWFYVEQAAAGRLDKPYRQRIYRLGRRGDGRIESAVYTIPEPLRFAGAWREPSRFTPLTPDSLVSRDGCEVLLKRKGKRYVGGTEGKGCASDLRGAAYATSEVEMDRRGMRTLDRGWQNDGTQSWGSTRGAYEFVRESTR